LLSYRCPPSCHPGSHGGAEEALDLNAPDLDAEIAAAAAQAGMSYSARLADTARKEFTIRAGLAAVGRFEADHGPFTPEELSAAEEWAPTAVERASRTGSSTRRRTA
jgi:hypothetical protein